MGGIHVLVTFRVSTCRTEMAIIVAVAVVVGVMVVVIVVIGAWQRQIIYKKVLDEIHAQKLGRHVEDDGIWYRLGDSPYFRMEDLQTGIARRDL